VHTYDCCAGISTIDENGQTTTQSSQAPNQPAIQIAKEPTAEDGERHAVTFRGQAAHSGSTPMNRRKDAFLAAARMSPEIYRIAERHGGVCTIGSCTTQPGIVTSVVADCRITLDQRHLDGAALARMLGDAREASEREHVCPYLYGHPELFAIDRPEAPAEYLLPGASVTVALGASSTLAITHMIGSSTVR